MPNKTPSNSEITVVLGFDMETDVGSWTPFYDGLVNGTPLMLDVLARHEVKSTCYFVGQAARDHPAVVRDVAAAGHEVGCHSLYHETVGDSIFPIPRCLRLAGTRSRAAPEIGDGTGRSGGGYSTGFVSLPALVRQQCRLSRARIAGLHQRRQLSALLLHRAPDCLIIRAPTIGRKRAI